MGGSSRGWRGGTGEECGASLHPIWVELLCRLGVGGCQGEWIPPKDRFRKEGWALGVVQGPLEPLLGGSEFSGMSVDPARAWALWPGQRKDRGEGLGWVSLAAPHQSPRLSPETGPVSALRPLHPCWSRGWGPPSQGGDLGAPRAKSHYESIWPSCRGASTGQNEYSLVGRWLGRVEGHSFSPMPAGSIAFYH